MAVINSSVAKIIFVVDEVAYKINISEKSCWYTLKNVASCSNRGIKYKLLSFVVHFVFNRNKIVCIQVKVLDSNFQLMSKMLVHFSNLGTHWAEMWNTVNCTEKNA